MEGAGEGVVDALAADFYIVSQNIDSVQAGNRKHHLSLVLELALSQKDLGGVHLAFQHGGKEIAIAASGLQKTAVNALRLLLYQIQHRVHLAFRREHFAVIDNTLL